MGGAQRTQVLAQRQVAAQQLHENRRRVRHQAHPVHAGRRTLAVDGQAHLVREHQVREVDAGGLGYRVVAPRPRVEVEQLVDAVSRVELVLELDQSVVVDLAQEPLGVGLDLGRGHRLDVGARAAELRRMLPAAASGHAADRLAVPAEGAVGELLLASAGNQLLDHDLALAGDVGRLLEQLCQLLSAVRPPGLGLGGVEELLLDARLERERRLAVDLVELAGGPRIPGPRRRDPEERRELVGVPLVPGPADDLPARHGDAVERRQLVAVLRQRRHGLVAGGEEDPAVQAEPPAGLNQLRHGAVGVAQVGHVHAMSRVARAPGDGALVVDDADGNAAAPEASHDSQSKVVTADHDSTGAAALGGAPGSQADLAGGCDGGVGLFDDHDC